MNKIFFLVFALFAFSLCSEGRNKTSEAAVAIEHYVSLEDSVQRHIITLSDKRQIIGRIVFENDESLRVESDTSSYVLPKSFVRSIEPYTESPKPNGAKDKPATQQPSVPTASEGQSSVPGLLDVIVLKGGSLIKGKIMKYEPLTVQTAESSLITLNMTDVISITRETSRPPASAPKLSSEGSRGSISQERGFVSDSPRRKPAVSIFAGLASPVGDFGESNVNVEKAGFASSGFAVGIEGNSGGETIQASYGGIVSFNGSDFGSVIAGVGSVPSSVKVQVESGSWAGVWLLLGGRVVGNVSPLVQIRGEALLGTLFGISPEIKVTARASSGQTASATIDKAVGVGLAYGAGAGLSISQFDLSLKYLTGSPEYEFKSGGEKLGKAKHPMSLLFFTAGIRF